MILFIICHFYLKREKIPHLLFNVKVFIFHLSLSSLFSVPMDSPKNPKHTSTLRIVSEKYGKEPANIYRFHKLNEEPEMIVI